METKRKKDKTWAEKQKENQEVYDTAKKIISEMPKWKQEYIEAYAKYYLEG